MSRIVTFYSYKGGVGRTFVMANVAVLLARRDLRVLIMDWDLEAPGLDRYFHGLIPSPLPPDKGILPLLTRAATRPETTWRDHIVPVTGLKQNATLDLIPSGAAGPGYAASLQAFSWQAFFAQQNGGTTLERWRDEWRRTYDFILIDSRTGLSDIGGVCTILLPDVLAAVFTANYQSAHGVRAVIDSAQQARQKLEVQRHPLTILPIPARFDGREEVALGEEWLDKFAELFGPVMDTWLPAAVPARSLLVKIKVPYVARFSFGEELAVETHGIEDSDLPGYSIAYLTDIIGSHFRKAEDIIRRNGSSASSTADSAPDFLVNGRFDVTQFETYLRGVQAKSASGPEVARLLDTAGTRLLGEARFDEAEPLLRLALTTAEAAYGKEHPEVATSLNNLAFLLKSTGRFSQAEPLMRRALQINEIHLGAKHPDISINLNNLAQLLQTTGRLAEAEPLMRRALTIDESLLGSEHPNVAIRLGNLARLLHDTNRLEEAEPLLRKALTVFESSFGKDHHYVALALNNLALLLIDTKRLTEAEPLLRRALAINEAALGSQHPNVAKALTSLALLLQNSKRPAEAEELLRRALGIDETVLGKEHPDVAIGLNNLAAVLQDLKRFPEAESLSRRALAIHEKIFGNDHPEVATDLSNLAGTLKVTGRAEEAEQLLRRAVEILMQFAAKNGHQHPNFQAMSDNYAAMLRAMRLGEAEVVRRVREVLRPILQEEGGGG